MTQVQMQARHLGRRGRTVHQEKKQPSGKFITCRGNFKIPLPAIRSPGGRSRAAETGVLCCWYVDPLCPHPHPPSLAFPFSTIEIHVAHPPTTLINVSPADATLPTATSPTATPPCMPLRSTQPSPTKKRRMSQLGMQALHDVFQSLKKSYIDCA